MAQRGGYVYILSNKSRTTLYVGVTNNLHNRVYKHKNGNGSKFTAKYKCFDLVYYVGFQTITEAINYEKKLKGWKRKWKDELIFSFNPELKDLYSDIKDII
jgi:putative endonuclease